MGSEDVKVQDVFLVERYAMQKHVCTSLWMFIFVALSLLARMIPVCSFIHKTSPFLLLLIDPFTTVLILL